MWLTVAWMTEAWDTGAAWAMTVGCTILATPLLMLPLLLVAVTMCACAVSSAWGAISWRGELVTGLKAAMGLRMVVGPGAEASVGVCTGAVCAAERASWGESLCWVVVGWWWWWWWW